jgi:hypothetical protein
MLERVHSARENYPLYLSKEMRVRKNRLVPKILALFWLVFGLGRAQIIAESLPGGATCVAEASKTIDGWSDFYFKGQRVELIEDMKKRLKEAASASWLFNSKVEAQTLVVAFPAKKVGDEEFTLVRVILDPKRPSARYLQGVRRVREIVVAPAEEARLSTVYGFQDARKPLEASWIEFTKNLTEIL